MEKVTFVEVLFSFVLWLFIYNNSKSIYYNSRSTQNSYLIFSILAVLFCTYAFYVGDFPHYFILYEDNLKSYSSIHVEPIYFWMIKNLPASYILWRMAVWGAALIVWIRIYKQLRLPAKYACIAMTLILLYYFSAPRQSLAFAILFLGIIYLLVPFKNKMLSYILGGTLICFSSFFHKSMPMFIVLTILSFLPLKKNFFTVSIILFPFLYGVVLLYAGEFISLFFSDDVGYETGMLYLEAESHVELTTWGWIQFFVTRLPIFFTIAYCVHSVFFKNNEIPFVYKTLIRYSYICLYLGLLFFQQETSSFLSPRFLDATYYPLAIVFPYFLYKEYKSKSMNSIIYMFLFSNIYLFAYTLYKL